MDLLKIETAAYAKHLLSLLKLNELDKQRQAVISKSKECETAVRALEALSMATKTPYVQMTTRKN